MGNSDAVTAFITGFPHQPARSLVVEGLRLHSENLIYVLVTTTDAEAADAWLAKLEAEDAKRVIVLSGTLNALDLGLSGAVVQRLLNEVQLVFHAGDCQRAGKHQRSLRAVVTLLGLAADMTALERVCIFSTAFVSGNRRGIIEEEELECEQRFNSPFERSMFALEKVARTLMPRLPITVLRPSAMIGDSETGEASGLTEGPNYLVRLMLRLPAEVPFVMPGRGVVPFNIVPINYVVQAAWVIARSPEARSRTFHLTDPNPVSAQKACEILGDLTTQRPKPFVAFGLPVRVLGRLAQWSGVSQLLPDQLTLLDDLTRVVTYRCSGALEVLAESGVVCRPFESYADNLVAWVARYERAQRNG